MKNHWKQIIALCCVSIAMAAGAEKKPNVIFILIDDLGYYDIGCYGATEVETPRIDKLAEEGIRFNDYYAAAPICSPSRVGFLTGCYPVRLGLAAWVQRPDSRLGIHPDETTIAEVFQQNGYSTACIGKWHVGDRGEHLPLQQGFDHYFGIHGNLDPWETEYFQDKGGVPVLRNEEVVKRPADESELTKIYTEEAMSYISGEVEKQKPFFLYFAHTMLHNPLGAGPEFRGTSNWDLYGDAIQELDHYTGKLVDHLKELGIENDTILVFASDNGRGPGRNESQPLKGRKLQTWETGIRVQAILHAPGRVEGGAVNSSVVSALDWYPTLASLAGIELEIRPDYPIDGRDLSSQLTGSNAPGINEQAVHAARPVRLANEWGKLFTEREYRDAFFYHSAEGSLSAVRSGKWKLYLHPGLKLHNLETDPGEMKPVRSPMMRALRGMAVTFQEEMVLGRRAVGVTTE